MTLFYAVLFISFFFIGLIIRLKRQYFQKVAQHSVSLVDALMSEIEEDEKVKQVQSKTNKLVVAMFKMTLALLIAFFVGGIPIAVYCLISEISFFLLDFSGFYSILVLSLGATLPFIIPFNTSKESSYSELSQLLHRMALDNYQIANKLFKREQKTIRKKKVDKNEEFVIVSGLARAGTTSLMNQLSEVDEFVSLSYANMPFLLCPNIWKKFYKPQKGKLKERSHKDGIMIGYNSNEALEEYFFKVRANDSYIKKEYLQEYNLSEIDYLNYIDYHAIIKSQRKKIYLAKNNNFILRYDSVRRQNEKFIMIIMFRHPLTHAASLLEKHIEYSKLQSEDPFVLEYMNWLGHHEFGLNHKFFRFNEDEYENHYKKASLNYWLKNWIYYYNHVLKIEHINTLLLDYDLYCKKPEVVINTVLNKVGCNSEIKELSPFRNSRKTKLEYDNELFCEAKDIYQKLLEKSSAK